MIHFVQHGSDGFGHQLHGLFSSLILNDIRNYHFDAYSFIKKKSILTYKFLTLNSTDIFPCSFSFINFFFRFFFFINKVVYNIINFISI